MAASDRSSSTTPTPSVPYSPTEQEQTFIDGVLTPKFIEIGNTFDAEVEKIRANLQQHLTSEFSSVRSELKTEVNQLREMLRSHLAALRSELITRTDDKLTTFQKASSPFATSSLNVEPGVMADV